MKNIFDLPLGVGITPDGIQDYAFHRAAPQKVLKGSPLARPISSPRESPPSAARTPPTREGTAARIFWGWLAAA